MVVAEDVKNTSLAGRLDWSALLVPACLLAYYPMFRALWEGPWQTEQEGHGPLIIAASAFLAWQARERFFAAPVKPAPLIGWLSIVFGLLLMFLGRTQGVLPAEAVSVFPVLCGCILLVGGWARLRALAFPIAFLVFAVPMPDWVIDTLTIPLKVMISNVVTEVLYRLDYPIAQNGVMLMIGTYQLMVKDACSGMNSIFALSAIGIFYAYVFRRDEKLRSALLIASIIPITIFANFLRVLALVLAAYYGGVDLIEGPVHDFTGIGLFVIAVVLLFLFDGLLGMIFGVWRRRTPAGAAPAAAQPA